MIESTEAITPLSDAAKQSSLRKEGSQFSQAISSELANLETTKNFLKMLLLNTNKHPDKDTFRFERDFITSSVILYFDDYTIAFIRYHEWSKTYIEDHKMFKISFSDAVDSSVSRNFIQDPFIALWQTATEQGFMAALTLFFEDDKDGLGLFMNGLEVEE